MTATAERTFYFGPFRLLPEQQLLLEGNTPVRLGSRALEILTVLVENAGELVSKAELMARVWPDTFVDESSLRVHVAGLRRALGDGQPGRRFLANAPGRGYRFVAPVESIQPEEPHAAPKTSPLKTGPPEARAHNLPVSQARALGRAATLNALLEQLPERRFITIVGPAGIGKTTAALALAETLLPAYPHGVWLADLASLDDPGRVPRAVGAAFGLTIHSESDIPLLTEFLRDRQMLIVLDNCEHVTEAAAMLAEHILAAAPGIHILATSRELLRAEGERVHRLAPLECPPGDTAPTAAEALAFPAVQLFVERASASLDTFELSDADAPVVADICAKLGGIALAIELAATRVDAFGLRQLSALLDDRFTILNRGRRTAQPRHRSLVAALDWSYEYLPESERKVLRRLSIFAGPFTLGSAIAVASDADADVIDGLADLVGKSLISADVSGPAVQYRLLDTTRAYAMQKLIESGEIQDLARRHAEHYCDLLRQIAADWEEHRAWQEEYGRRIDDVRAALKWAYSSDGDTLVGLALTFAAIPFWLELSLLDEGREGIERALDGLLAQPAYDERDELKLRIALGHTMWHSVHPMAENYGQYAKALALAEKLGDRDAEGQALYHLSVHSLYVGDVRGMLAYAERCHALVPVSAAPVVQVMGTGMIGIALHHLGEHARARDHMESILSRDYTAQRTFLTFSAALRLSLCGLLWVMGFPDQAMGCVGLASDETGQMNNPMLRCNQLVHAISPTALYAGDLAAAEDWAAMLLDISAKSGLARWNALGHCLKGQLLVAKGDYSGLVLLRGGLDRLRAVGFAYHYAFTLGALAEGLGSVGRLAEAQAAIGEALECTDRTQERWCLPELLRIKGELRRLDGTMDAAEDCFIQSLDEARRQGALSWELRAIMSLARLWREDGKAVDAAKQLSAVYNRFTEGFDTADLKAARALLRGLPTT